MLPDKKLTALYVTKKPKQLDRYNNITSFGFFQEQIFIEGGYFL